MSLRDIFSNSITFRVINKYGKGGAVQISTVFGPSYMLLAEGWYERGLFRDLINHVFRIPKFRKCISYHDHLCFENFKNLVYISKMQQQIGQIFFVSEIIASELAVLNCLW